MNASATVATGVQEPGHRLAFFLSSGGSLGKWQREGILDREMLLPLTYLRLGTFDAVDLFSYDPADADLIGRLQRTEPLYAKIRLLLPPKWLGASGWGRMPYSLIGPFLHRSALSAAAVLKTNQVSGAWAAMIAARIVGRPLVLRMGYVLSNRFRLGGDRLRSLIASILERLACRQAQNIIVTSTEAHASIAAITADPTKVHLVPTYVDASLFRQKSHYDFSGPILFVGRLAPIKNLPALIAACGKLGRELHLVGVGPLQAELERAALAAQAKVRFLGRVPNDRLADMMQNYTVLALTSLHEGLPKVLIEAMASGMVCVGTNVPGIADLIVDGQTGYLANGVSAEAVAEALGRCLTEANEEIGAAARLVVEKSLSIESYARTEGALLLAASPARSEIAGEGAPSSDREALS